MFVTNRKLEDTVILTDTETGKQITVQVLEIRGNAVKLGFEAPQTIHFLRGELVKDKEQKQ